MKSRLRAGVLPGKKEYDTVITIEHIKEWGRESGIDTVRVTSSIPLRETATIIKERCSAGLIPYDSEWATGDILKYCTPSFLLPDARSVIVAGLCCLVEEKDDGSEPGNPHGIIAPYTRSNYYRALKKRLEKLAGWLRRQFPSGKFSIASNGFLREKPLAARSGLGFYGNHGIIITPDFGSWVVLGLIVTDISLPENSPLTESCHSCSLCIAACPTQAIVEPGIIDITRCLQHLSQQEGPIPREYRVLWGNRLYGCTTCQEVCPRNRIIPPRTSRPSCGLVGPSQPLIPLLNLPDAELHERFKGNQMGARWVSPAALKKNICVALGNSGEEAAAESLAGALSHPSMIVREHASWALARLGEISI